MRAREMRIFCITARDRCIQHTLRTLTGLHAPQGARSAAPTAKSSDLQWESAESTSWGRWKCSTLRPSTALIWPLVVSMRLRPHRARWLQRMLDAAPGATAGAREPKAEEAKTEEAIAKADEPLLG